MTTGTRIISADRDWIDGICGCVHDTIVEMLDSDIDSDTDEAFDAAYAASKSVRAILEHNREVAA